MNVILWLIVVAAVFFFVERLWPAAALRKVRGWWARIALVNLAQLGIVLLAGRLWDRWFQRVSPFQGSDALGDMAAALVAFFVSCIVFYAWHRARPESHLFWKLCHQLLQAFGRDHDQLAALRRTGVWRARLTPERHSQLSGPYNRRNVLGAALAEAPRRR